jgi:cell cycle arrest protein BUB2
MSTSPTKVSNPSLAPPNVTAINSPPSPGSHRTLRRLQSAHTLGSLDVRSHGQPSLISQQRQHLQQQQQQNQSTSRNFSPVRKDQTTASYPQSTAAHNRIRSNSDAAVMINPGTGSVGGKQVVSKRIAAADAIHLDRLIRDGPQDGDLASALESTRLKILDQGVKSDTDGMVEVQLSNE